MRVARKALLPLLLLSISHKRCTASEQEMADRGYSVPARGAAQHPQLFIEYENELTDLSSIQSSIKELRSQAEALRIFVGREFTELKRGIQRVAAYSDCLVLSARTDTPPKYSNAANSRGRNFFLSVCTVFNAYYTTAGACSGISDFIYQRLKDESLTIDNERPL
jgi:hypothetical protein